MLDLAKGTGTDVGVVHAWIRNSRHEHNWCWRVVEGRVLRTQAMPRIRLLGVAYKEDTRSAKNSDALALLARLRGLDLGFTL